MCSRPKAVIDVVSGVAAKDGEQAAGPIGQAGQVPNHFFRAFGQGPFLPDHFFGRYVFISVDKFKAFSWTATDIQYLGPFGCKLCAKHVAVL